MPAGTSPKQKMSIAAKKSHLHWVCSAQRFERSILHTCSSVTPADEWSLALMGQINQPVRPILCQRRLYPGFFGVLFWLVLPGLSPNGIFVCFLFFLGISSSSRVSQYAKWNVCSGTGLVSAHGYIHTTWVQESPCPECGLERGLLQQRVSAEHTHMYTPGSELLHSWQANLS